MKLSSHQMGIGERKLIEGKKVWKHKTGPESILPWSTRSILYHYRAVGDGEWGHSGILVQIRYDTTSKTTNTNTSPLILFRPCLCCPACSRSCDPSPRLGTGSHGSA